MNRTRSGFTIVEVIVSIMVVSVGFLALLATTANTTRTLTRGRNADIAAVFAANRLESLRLTACTVRVNGADTLFRGSTWISINTWTFTDAGNSLYRIKLTDKYVVGAKRTSTDVLETSVSCLI